MAGAGLIWDLIARDNASPTFLRVAGAADKAAASTERAAVSTERSIARMSKVGATLTKSLTVPILGVAAVGIDQAIKFQKSMTLIQTAGGETAAKAAVISAGIKKVAVETGTSLGDLGEGIYTVAKAGAQKWSAVDQLKVLKAAAQGAKAEAVPLGVAVDALSTIMFDYGAKAGDAVKYENMLVRGSGLAKTSMQEYASSLSNVVPIAAAVGLSFQQVGGAIATMTQHGMSAKQATDNLHNLVVNLAGQNNVASSAMQQLGINTLDLSKNLGKRGLTGSLEIVDKALRDHTKNGMIVTSTYKAAKLANQSLSTEMGTFNGKLKDQSKGLLDGKVGIKDYTSYAKSLGGTAGASALQFLALYKSSQGFSDQLKSGKSTITTTVAALNKMLGGMTGSNVAMMIGGKYAAQNAANVKAMGKAFLESGSDVLGWNKTQDTLAVKMDKAKASLQVLAVEIGTALIPAVSKIVGWVTQAVHWFSNLSGTQKQVLGWSVGILAALGPVLSIGGRVALVGRGLGTFAVGMGNMFARITTGATGMSAGVTRAVSGMTSALAGVGIGMAVGSLTKNSSTTTKVLGSLGAAAAGAAIGFGVGGPIGAAIGGLGAGLGSLAVSFLSVGKSANQGAKAAQAALAAQKQDADDLLGSLQSVNGAYDAQYRNSIIKKLDTSGALGIASKAGVNLPSLVDSVLGKGGVGQVTKIRTQIEDAFAAGKINPAQYAKLDSVMQSLGISSGEAEKRLQLEAQAAGAALLPNSALGTSIAKLRAAFTGSGTAIDNTSGAGLRNTAIIKQNLDAINTSAASQLKHGKSVASVASAYESQIGTLHKNLDALHFNDAEVGTLIGTYARMPKSVLTELIKRGVVPADIQTIIDKYNQMPKSKSTSVGLNDHASGPLSRINAWLLGLPSSKTITVTTVTRTGGSANASHTNRKPQANAGGGVLSDGPFTVGERGWELGYKRGSHIEIYSNQQSKAMTGWDRVPGFATGTAKAAKAFAAAHAGLSSSDLSAAVSAIGALLAAARNTSDSAGDIRNAAASLRSAARDSRLTNRAYVTMVADAKRRDSINSRLGTAPGGTTAYDRLAAAKTAYSDNYSTTKTATSAYDITQLGIPTQVYTDQPAPAATAGTILAALTKTASTARSFANLLKKLIREGMPRNIVMQLAAAGPGALAQAQALSLATPKQIAGFKSQDSALNAAGVLAGKSTADAYYLSGVRSAQGLVNGLLSQRNALNKAITRLADGMVNTLKHKLKIHSPSQVMFEHGAHTGEGFRLGVESKLGGVEQASSKMANAVQPTGRGGGAHHVHNHQWNISGQTDPVATANAALRRLEAALAG